ncbi:MAG: alpha/beta fold hydrolase [Cyanobacteria bacterium J06649_5]
MVKATVRALEQATQAIEAHLKEVRSHPDQRSGAHPYYRFHPAGESIGGTVLIFHGFSARPHQMWRLADYLYDNGFNFYQVPLAGHDRCRPAKNWPQIDLKPENVAPLMAKVQQDAVLSSALSKSTSMGNVATQMAPGQQAALLDRLFEVVPEVANISAAISQPNHPDFARYFVSSHDQFLADAKARLAELAALPGPVYTVGLSVGGTVALGLAQAAPERIERVVVYAPLLKIFGKKRREYVQLTGPLDISETGWDPALRFPVGALTAADYFGSEVRSPAGVKKLKAASVFMTLTENEDAADIEASEQFFRDLAAQSGAKVSAQAFQEGKATAIEANGHQFYKYPSAAMVPHPMVDPTEVSQGMSNLFWQSLYQETLRFLTAGQVNFKNLGSLVQTSDISAVAPAEISLPQRS